MAEKDIEQVRTFTRMVAEKQGWVLNPDPEFYGSLVEGLRANWNRHGYFLCPCRDSEGGKEEDRNSICPCVWSRADIEKYGHCYCALYCSKTFVESGREPSGIPDGRYSS